MMHLKGFLVQLFGIELLNFDSLFICLLNRKKSEADTKFLMLTEKFDNYINRMKRTTTVDLVETKKYEDNEKAYLELSEFVYRFFF
jgi:hypothetical protein